VVEQDFFRFPHTPHLTWLGASEPRDDKVLSHLEMMALLARPVRVEEKLDGANLGLSINAAGEFRFQNRGQYLERPHHGQFARLDDWLAAKADSIVNALSPSMLVFGEWCAARHSLDYQRLPDWWLVFDIYDRTAGRFWSADRRDAWATAHGLIAVATLKQGKFTQQELVAMVDACPSRYREGPLEGIVVRSDTDMWNDARAKLARADFVQSMRQHWRNRRIDWNRLAQSTI
jgi:ATP-dependent RNA circularization protein (DNA/RNA ligase family)